MGRGLGQQQRNLLVLLLRRGVLRTRAILGILWGWRGRIWRDGQVFARNDIGIKEYGVRYASLSRTLLSLRRRELIQVYKNVAGSGTVIGLSAIGRQVAEEIAEEEGGEPEP